ncbi:MAG: phosphoribosyltransferase [Gammaproteobacteria bacterium]|nr:MAG: phosphoribosyltransferase [Gammaproteobacteria bacterium]
MRCEKISWSQVERLCLRLANMIRESGYHPDIVIAIGRGGYVPARLVCDYLNLMNLTSIKIEHYLSGVNRQKEAVIRYPLKIEIRNQKVLLVDDVNDTGDTLEVALRHLQTFQPAQVRTAVMHHKAVAHCKVNYYAKKVIRWRWLMYPWAVYEDISGFLMSQSQIPESLDEAQMLLLKRYNIDISLKRLGDIYTFMGWHS